MRQLLPVPIDEFDVNELLSREDRRAPPDRPWVMANMVMSADGAFSIDGRSGALGGPADRVVFHTLRAAADVILVGAGTARAERYRRPSPSPELAALRQAAGLVPAPRLVVVSRRLAVPADQPFLVGDGPAPLLVHPGTADPTAAPHGVETRAAGTSDAVDLGRLLGDLHREGIRLVMCEGGPGLLGDLHSDGLIDELFVTLSPMLVGGTRVGLLGHVDESPRQMTLHRLLEADAHLFLTYRVTR